MDTRKELRKLLFKLSLKSDLLPSSIFLEGVACEDRHNAIQGGFGQVHVGTHGQQKVALKQLYTACHVGAIKASITKKVSLEFLRAGEILIFVT